MDSPSSLGARTRQVVGAKHWALRPTSAPRPRQAGAPASPSQPLAVPDPPARGFPKRGETRAVQFARCLCPVGRWNRLRATTPEMGVEAALL